MKRCKNCDNHYQSKDKRSKFCSRSCSATFNNKGIARNVRKHKKGNCLFCDVEFTKQNDTRNNKFCKQCVADRVYNKTHFLHEAQTDRTRRRILIRQRGHKCEICENNSWNEKPIPLEIDHIDGNSDNNKENNLRVICPNCHAQTPNYKAKNLGNGKHYRRQRYAEGKSY